VSDESNATAAIGWRGKIKGTPRDLERLVDWARQLGYRIAVEGEDHMLCADAFEQLNDPRAIRDSVQHLLEQVNRAARQRFPGDFGGLDIGGINLRSREGLTHHVLVADTGHYTASFGGSLISPGSSRRAPPSVPELMGIAARNEDLKRALDHIQRDPTWTGYFMAFEAVKDANGGSDGIAAISSLIQRTGGEPTSESLEHKGARIRRATDFEKKRQEFLRSEGGVESAKTAVAEIIAIVKSRCAALAEIAPLTIKQHANSKEIAALAPTTALMVHWIGRYSNTLEDSYLEASYWAGYPPLYAARYFDGPPPQLAVTSMSSI
jgi:hypothetical protein